ncbi:MAG: restriction endonuclease subunit S [Synechococcaceae cyanobacterium]|jgi:type I restriction enzyme S subunit
MELKPGYKQTEVGVIPEEWEVCPVERKGQVMAGKALAVHAPGEQKPYLRTKNVFDGRIDIDDVLTMPMTEEQFAQFQLRHGDVLLNEGQSLELVGRCSIYKDDYPAPCAIQNALLRFRPRPETSASFASHLFRNCQKTGVFAKIALQTTSVAHLGSSRFASLRLAWPTTNEQIAIAAALDDIDHLIKSLDDLITKKRGIKQAAMQELLTGKRRLPGFEGEWEEFSLGSVASMNSGGTPPTGRDDYYGGGIPWVSISDMTSGGKFISQTERTLSAAGLANCAAKQFPSGTVLYAMYASLGECSIAATEVTSSQAILGIRPGASLHNEFLFYCLSSIHDKVKLMGQQGTQSNLNKGIVQGFTLSLPGKAEQIAIAEALGEIDQELDALSMKAQKIREMKAGMMQELLTGRIRLR